MKSHIFITAVLVCSSAFARADVEVTMAALRRIGFLPQDKADLHPEEKIDLKRHNPFAERRKAVVAKSAESVETEESKLRAFFDKLQVTGLMKLGDKRSVTLGRLTLEQGQTLQPVIPGQTQILRVLRVEDNLLEIGWVEDGVAVDVSAPRKISKKIDLRPAVTMLLPTEQNVTDAAQTYTVDDKGKVQLTPRNVFPNPSAIADNLPPGSDNNPTAALSEEEQAQMKALEAAQPQGTPAPAPDRVPDAVPQGAGAAGGATPPPPPNPEDPVQPDPDAANPAAKPAQVTPAGIPQKIAKAEYAGYDCAS